MKHLARTYLAALCAALACTAALSAALPLAAVDGAALQSIADANDRTAHGLELSTCAAERRAVGDTKDCKDSACVIAVKALAALTPCAAMQARDMVARQAAPPPTIINAAPPPTVGERIVGLFAGGIGKIFDTAIALGPSYLNMRLGTTQSNNQTALGIVNSNNALGATQSTNGAFAAFGNNLQGLGTAGFNANAAIAGSGFAAVTNVAGNGFSVARDLGMRPSTQVTGNGNSFVNGNGNTTLVGQDNRVSSPGPCQAAATVTTPATATPTATTGSPPATAAPAPVVTLTSDCAK